MRASVSEQVGSPFTTKEIEIAEPLDREVLIDVRASGLCHSDLHIVESGYGFGFPGVFGHELAGVVTAVGPEVSTIAVGDHVVGCLIQFCGACTTCLSGRTSLDSNRTCSSGSNA